jgi:hypothetical protein
MTPDDIPAAVTEMFDADNDLSIRLKPLAEAMYLLRPGSQTRAYESTIHRLRERADAAEQVVEAVWQHEFGTGSHAELLAELVAYIHANPSDDRPTPGYDRRRRA